MTARRLIIIVLAVAAGAIFSRVTARPPADLAPIVAAALTPNPGERYVAEMATDTICNGKQVKARARVYHDGPMEKIEYVCTKGRSLWSMTADGKSYTYLPRENKLLVSETSKLLSGRQRTALLLRNYRATSGGIERIAGRSAYVVEIVSKYDGRPSKKLWIGKQRHTILKSIDYSAAGQQISSTETTRIRYGASIPAGTFAIPSRANRVMACTSSDSPSIFGKLGISVHRPKWVPVGYVSEGYHLYNCQCTCSHQCAQLTYTDGLNMVSVFESPKMSCGSGGCQMPSGRRGKCVVANCGMAKTGAVTRGDKTVVVVGDLMPTDVSRIAESVN